jgi:hypothetical protein
VQVVRKIIDSEVIGSVIPLPKPFRHGKVEVIVMPVQERAEAVEPKKSYFGALAKYANPSLAEQEKGAWAVAMVKK